MLAELTTNIPNVKIPGTTLGILRDFHHKLSGNFLIKSCPTNAYLARVKSGITYHKPLDAKQEIALKYLLENSREKPIATFDKNRTTGNHVGSKEVEHTGFVTVEHSVR